MQDAPQLTPKCEDCAALCCVVLPFDAGAAFGFDKAGGEPCRHLSGHTCDIHANLGAHGFAGCVRFDCLGAGQRVVQEVFGGQSWRDDASLLAPMEQAFRAMRRLHEDYGLLNTAARLPLTEPEQTRRHGLLSALAIATPQTLESLSAYETGPLPRAVQSFLTSLRPRLTPRP